MLRLGVASRGAPTSDDGRGSDEMRSEEVRAAVREALEELRERMEREGRFLYWGRWRTREEIRTLGRQARMEELARVRDVGLALLVSLALVAVAYQFLFFLFP